MEEPPLSADGIDGPRVGTILPGSGNNGYNITKSTALGTTNMKTRWSQLLVATLIGAGISGAAFADRWNIENPNLFPGVWYRINFDSAGTMTEGTGDGQGWYYYPTSGVYRMWWHNGAYDVNRKGRLEYRVYSEAINPDALTYARIRYVWTTAEWSQSGHTGLPYPSDLPTVADEAQAVSTEGLMTIDNWSLGVGSSEAEKVCVIRDYNPEWVGIEIEGRNLHVCRFASHECLPKEEEETPSLGAWCDRQTGACYIGTATEGEAPYVWLGAGSSCADCTRLEASGLDFGDAPDPTYPTLLAHNGARHTIVADLFLGRGVDAERDGQPDSAATGDDRNGADEDGVVFLSALQPGTDALIEVVASAQGYLNAWIDFDRDGSFASRNEQIFADQLLASGTNRLTFAVPAEAGVGPTFARFRFNSRGLLSFDGPAADGEVEDYRVVVATPYEPHATSGVTAALWTQLPSVVAAAEPFTFEAGGASSALHLHQIAADDWQLPDDRPVTGIHWWGTFDGWTESSLPPEMPLAFHLGIWTGTPDPDPARPDTFAHPDTLVWESYCTNWTWALSGFEPGDKSGLGQTCFQFTHLLSQDQWFQIERAAEDTGAGRPVTYWLSISAVYDPKGAKPAHEWTWKTRPGGPTAAATSIRAIAAPAATPAWPAVIGARWQDGQPLRDQALAPVDMVFQLTTYAPAELTAPAPGGPKTDPAEKQ
jgi:hypothetical protein